MTQAMAARPTSHENAWCMYGTARPTQTTWPTDSKAHLTSPQTAVYRQESQLHKPVHIP